MWGTPELLGVPECGVEGVTPTPYHSLCSSGPNSHSVTDFDNFCFPDSSLF